MKLTKEELEMVYQELYIRLDDYENWHDLEEEEDGGEKYLSKLNELLSKIKIELSICV
jgi:hypothetical protein